MYKQFLRPGLKDIKPPDEKWLEDWRPAWNTVPDKFLREHLNKYDLPRNQKILQQYSAYHLLECRDEENIVYLIQNDIIDETVKITYPKDVEDITAVLRYYDTEPEIQAQFMVLELLQEREKDVAQQTRASMQDQSSQPAKR